MRIKVKDKYIGAGADVIFGENEFKIYRLKEEIRGLNRIQNKDNLTKHKIRALEDLKESDEEQMLEILSDVTYECFYCSKEDYNIYKTYNDLQDIEEFLRHLKQGIINILPTIQEKHLTVKFVKCFQPHVSLSGDNTVKPYFGVGSNRILSVNFKDYCILMQGLQLNDENELICE